jgi:ATP-dependent DNA helicase RecQ
VPKTRAERKKRAANSEAAPLNEMEKMRFELLREWRMAKARELDVPAFVVFSDRSLKELARANPNQISQLEDVYGFGPTKIERFGKEVLLALGNC